MISPLSRRKFDLKSAWKTRFRTPPPPPPGRTHPKLASNDFNHHFGPSVIVLICRTRPMSVGNKEKPDVRRSPRVLSRQQKVRYPTPSSFVRSSTVSVEYIGFLRLLGLSLSALGPCVLEWYSLGRPTLRRRSCTLTRRDHPAMAIRALTEMGGLGPDGCRERARHGFRNITGSGVF